MKGIARLWPITALAALSTPAAAQQPDWRATGSALDAVAGRCAPSLPEGPRYASVSHERDARRLLAALLEADPAQCPDGPRTAAAAALRLLGEPEAPAADPQLLRLAWTAAERGLGMARDEILADRLGRLLWLYEDAPPPLPRWPEAARQAWLEQPATIALLEARAGQGPRVFSTRTVADRLATLKLRRDLPGYDPARAFALLDQNWLLIPDDRRVAFSRLVTGGEHVPAQYERARRALILFGSYGNRATPEVRAELLRVGLAASPARAPGTQAAAMRILFAAAMDGHADETAARDRLLRRLGRIPNVALDPADAARISEVMYAEFYVRLGYAQDGDPETLSPIRLRGLIAPDGRVALAQVTGSSGLSRRDRGILAAWAEMGHLADLSATARGRWVWVDLPPVEPVLRHPAER